MYRLTRWLMMAVLSVTLSLFAPSAAHAQTTRLSIVENVYGTLWHQWSDDGGNTLSPWYVVPPNWMWDSSVIFTFVGAPAGVSEGRGGFALIALNDAGVLLYNALYTSNNRWDGWDNVPGAGPGYACINNRCWHWLQGSNPAVSSWGPGRLDIFMNAVSDDGAIGLLHTWADGSIWSERWEVLGTGEMQGSPTATSWAPGRIDVFVIGGGNELVHKWFGNGHWSSGWDNLGGYLTSSPAAAADGDGRLNIVARGGDGQLWSLVYADTWASWAPLSGLLGDGTSPTITSRGWGMIDVLVYGADSLSIYLKSYDDYHGWGDYRFMNYPSLGAAAVAYVP